MSNFVPAGYLHLVEAVMLWAKVSGLPVPQAPPRRSNGGPSLTGRDWERASEALRQELFAGTLRAFTVHPKQGLWPVEPAWWCDNRARQVLDGARGASSVGSWPTVLLRQDEIERRIEKSNGSSPPSPPTTRYRGLRDPDASFVERASQRRTKPTIPVDKLIAEMRRRSEAGLLEPNWLSESPL
jgi:hypothetical protein